MTTCTPRPDGLPISSRPFTTSQADAMGIARSQLRLLVSEGQVRQVLRNVYVAGDLVDTIELRASAASLVTPPHSVICDRTAAWLWGVDAFRHWELDILPPLDTFVLRGKARVRRREARGGERDLQTDDITMIGDVRVTAPARTSLDLACRLSRPEGLAVMDGFARTHGVGADELRRLLPRYRRRRGVVQARELVPLVDGRSESTGESFTKLAIHDAGLPPPEPQYWVGVAGVPVYRLDLAYPRLKICVEYDGEEFHSSEKHKASDRKRRKWLRDNGWVIIVVTKDDLRGPGLEAWLQELTNALAQRMR